MPREMKLRFGNSCYFRFVPHLTTASVFRSVLPNASTVTRQNPSLAYLPFRSRPSQRTRFAPGPLLRPLQRLHSHEIKPSVSALPRYDESPGNDLARIFQSRPVDSTRHGTPGGVAPVPTRVKPARRPVSVCHGCDLSARHIEYSQSYAPGGG